MKHVGYLGASEGWYCRDLQRAAGLGHWPEPVAIQPLAFADLQVAYRGGPSSQFSASADIQSNAYHALMVRTMPIGSLEQTI
jgi:hypothetical protein